LRIGLSWTLYWIGDVVSRAIVHHTLGHYFEWPYRFYNMLMVWACELQGDDPRGPWGPTG
jgi:hypothetical protein